MAVAPVNLNLNLKVLPSPTPEKFNTFNIFNTFAVFSRAPDYSTLVHPQAPRIQSVSASAVSTLHLPLLSPTGRVPEKRMAGKGE
jgi:hypothetical protein